MIDELFVRQSKITHLEGNDYEVVMPTPQILKHPQYFFCITGVPHVVLEIPEEKEVIVYWTPNGKSYHMKNTCRTLARSKVILSGNTLECEKAICCEHCKIEEDKNKI